MNIEEKDVITLSDDKEYLVVRKVTLDNVIYYYVANTKDLLDVKYLYEKGDKLIKIHDDNLLVRVMEEIAKTIDIDKILNNKGE